MREGVPAGLISQSQKRQPNTPKQSSIGGVRPRLRVRLLSRLGARRGRTTRTKTNPPFSARPHSRTPVPTYTLLKAPTVATLRRGHDDDHYGVAGGLAWINVHKSTRTNCLGHSDADDHGNCIRSSPPACQPNPNTLNDAPIDL